jgi:hypothetical protein
MRKFLVFQTILNIVTGFCATMSGYTQPAGTSAAIWTGISVIWWLLAGFNLRGARGTRPSTKSNRWTMPSFPADPEKISLGRPGW